jgi:cytochrome c-type biogenesis protein CcmH/NrfG
LAVGQFADAIAAFHQARALEPTHPHVAGRLAEVERRQHAASVTPLGNTTV